MMKAMLVNWDKKEEKYSFINVSNAKVDRSLRSVLQASTTISGSLATLMTSSTVDETSDVASISVNEEMNLSREITQQ